MAVVPGCSVDPMYFGGCEVIDFSANAGWNAQLSEVTINVAACATCMTPEVGTLHTFSAGSFSFRGLLQSWNMSRGSDGNPVYSYKLVSPHPILDYTQIIVADYQGEVANIFNIANVYGFMESIDGKCDLTVDNKTEFGAPAEGFGNANSTGRGMPWPKVKDGLQALLGGGGSGKFCAGFGFRDVQCNLDVSSLPISSMSYRIAGPSLSLSDLINQVCEDGGCDWYAQFIGNTIKISVIERNNAPALGGIDSFVNNPANLLISSSIGRELRAETHSAMVVGGHKRQLYPCTDSKRMEPFWGWDLDGTCIQSKTNDDVAVCKYEVNLDFRKINIALATKFPSDFCYVGENEIRAAMGNYESFIANVVGLLNREDLCGETESCLGKYLGCTLGVVAPLRDANPGNATDHTGGTVSTDISGEVTSPNLRDAKILHSWLQSYANDFYGKQFLVYFKLDDVVCKTEDPETKQILYSDEVSPEGGWPVEDDVLGLDFDSFKLDLFRDVSGKVQPMMKFKQEQINTKALSVGDFVSDDTFVWVKASVDSDWVLGTPEGHDRDEMVCALIQLSAPLLDQAAEAETIESNTLTDSFARTGPLAINSDVNTVSMRLGAQAETIRALGPPAALYPTAIGVPMKSNTNSYGPWWAVGMNPGCAQFQIDEGLVPWEYGGPTYLNLAGRAKVDTAVTDQFASDRGSVTVPGPPMLNLGSNLGGSNASLGEGFGGFGGFNWPTFANNMSAGAVISSIQVSVGAGGFTTTYEVTSFTPVYGRFSKGNAARLKQIGMNRLKANREMRAREALTRLLKGGKAIGGGGGGTGGGGALSRQSSTDIGKGNIAPVGTSIWIAGTKESKSRKTVLLPTASTMPFYKNYDNTAVMTMDGFFRPVESYGGSTNLPEVNNTSNVCGGAVPTQSSGPPGPGIFSNNAGELEEYKPLPIKQEYLDFLTDNVSHPEWNQEGNNQDRWTLQTETEGHDIEGVARKTITTMHDGDVKQRGRLLMQESGDYANKYRFMALRGPLVIQGWGYDLHGKPIPNEESDSGPNFKNSYVGLTDKFKSGYLQDSTQWPIAPVDLRFDRKRGVWTIPPAYRMFQVETSGEIAAGDMGYANIKADTSDLCDEEGNFLASPILNLRNWTSNTLSPGTQALAYYDTASCEYWVVSAASGSSGNVRVAYSGCDPAGGTDCYGLTGCMIFSTGIGFTQWNIDANAEEKDGPDLRITGPKIALNANSCHEEVIAPTPFDQLTFGSGLQLVRDGGEDSCNWILNSCASGTTSSGTLTVGYSGCSGDIEGQIGCYSLTGCMIFSTGIGFTQWNQTMNIPEENGPDLLITGPKIASSSGCGGGETIDPTSFDQLTFGSGLGLVQDGGEGSCNWLVTGPKIASRSGCEGSETIDPTSFGLLTFGSGLELVRDGDEDSCNWILNSCASGTGSGSGTLTVGYSGCDPDESIDCYSLTGCMVYSTGIGFTQNGPDLLITGPKIALGKASCSGETIAPMPFDLLTFGSGMHLIKGEESCDYIASSCTVGYNGLVTVATSICCSGDMLIIEYSGLNYSDGLLKSVDAGLIPDCNNILC